LFRVGTGSSEDRAGIRQVETGGTILATPEAPATVRAPAGAGWIRETVLASPSPVVGVNVGKRDALAKVRGEAKYAGDLSRPGMVYGKVVRSPYARARVKSIDAAAALAAPGVLAVLTAVDIPGLNRVGARAVKDQPVLVEEMVILPGEAVALVVAESNEAAADAAKLVQVDYEALAPLTDPELALAPDAPQLHPGGNLCHQMRIVRGDFEAAVRAADLVVTNTYTTQAVDHGYIEPDAVLAESSDGGVNLYVTSKSPHNDQGEVAGVLGLAKDKVRVVVVAVGGSFGGKPDIPMLCLCALIAMKTGRPAKMILEREECLIAKAKRHPYKMVYSHAMKANGDILGVKVEILADAGAYAGYTPTVVSKGLIHAAGCYRAGCVDMRVRAVYTNNPNSGAMRGYGVPQTVFAVERQMDIIARELVLDPFELRMRNIFRPGDITGTGQVLIDVRLAELMRRARDRVAAVPAAPAEAPHIRRAWGTAAFFYGAGRTGVADQARVAIKLLAGGEIRVFVGTPDTGQGSDTVLAQIAAEELGLPFELVQLTSADTALTFDCGTSTASRVTYVVGSAVKRAATELKGKLLAAMAQMEGRPVGSLPADPGYLAHLAHFCLQAGLETEAEGYFETSTSKLDANGQGSPYGAYTYGVQMTEVKVNLWTGKVDVEQAVCVYDAGKVVNPILLEGQIEGGSATAQGFALTEDLGLKDGMVGNRNLDTYLMPTAADVPPMDVTYLDGFEQSGPFGAKGVGEPTTLPGAAAIANAVSAAVGKDFFDLPLTPESVVRVALS
jgi:nicotinate dehydrogenase large molybdopterin subunit